VLESLRSAFSTASKGGLSVRGRPGMKAPAPSDQVKRATAPADGGASENSTRWAARRAHRLRPASKEVVVPVTMVADPGIASRRPRAAPLQ